MEILQLKYFIHVAETEHISNAAEDLHISQPALSLTIQRLENELGVKLFKKEGRNIRLTDEGRDFLSKVKPAYNMIVDATESIKATSEKNKKRVSIVSPPLYSFPDLLKCIHKEIPDLIFRNTYTSTSDAKEMLLKKHIDFFIAPFDDVQDLEPIFKATTLKKDSMVAVLPKNHRLAQKSSIDPMELKDETFASYPEHLGSRHIIEKYYKDHGTEINVELEGNTAYELVDSVASGSYVSMIQGNITRYHNRSDISIVPLDPPIRTTLELVVLKDEKLRPVARKVLNIITNYFNQYSSI